MDNLIISKLHKQDIELVAAILTDAFITNPAYSLIFKKVDQREEGLFWLFKTNLLILNQAESFTHVVKDKCSGKIIGTYTILPPQGVKTSLSTYAKIGLFRFLFKFGVTPLIRMLSLDKYNNKLLDEAIIVSEYYYLHLVAVKKEYRGSGIGSYMIKSAIQERTNSNPACRLLGLTTQLPENVAFYSRLGFAVLDEGIVEFKESRYFNSNMSISL